MMPGDGRNLKERRLNSCEERVPKDDNDETMTRKNKTKAVVTRTLALDNQTMHVQ